MSGQVITKRREKYFSARRICMIAVFTSMSAILYMFIKFPLPFLFPSFLDFQISDAPALIAGFLLGPISGFLVLAFRIGIKLIFIGTSTAYIGELADLIIGILFVIPASIIYRKSPSKNAAKLGLIIGSIAAISGAVFINYFLLIPFYVSFFFGGNFNILLNIVRPLYSSVTEKNFFLFYIPLAVIPFNLIRCILSSILTYLLYKNLRRSFFALFNELPYEDKFEKFS